MVSQQIPVPGRPTVHCMTVKSTDIQFVFYAAKEISLILFVLTNQNVHCIGRYERSRRPSSYGRDHTLTHRELSEGRWVSEFDWQLLSWQRTRVGRRPISTTSWSDVGQDDVMTWRHTRTHQDQ